MKCPFCKHDDDRVVDSRSSSDGFVIRRRRECNECSRRYTTYERIEEAPLRVVKKDGTRVPFERQKILNGLLTACQKRPVTMEEIEAVVNEVERELYEKFEKEVPSQEIGSRVMERLRTLDDIAYVRFASVYREFKDASEFMSELKPMLD
jgi:transcriptional repressor NrdR